MSLSFVMNQFSFSHYTRKEQVNEAVEKEKEEPHAKSIALNTLRPQLTIYVIGWLASCIQTRGVLLTLRSTCLVNRRGGGGWQPVPAHTA